MALENQKGVAAVEFAITLPLLVMLLFGSIEFGLLVYNKQVVTNASRVCARAAITEETIGSEEQALLKQLVQDYCENNLISLGGDNTLDPTGISISSPDADNDLTVSVSYDYAYMFASLFGLTNTSINGQTVMRKEL